MGLPAKSPQAILWGPRVGGGTTFPARRVLYFTFEYDETRRKGVTILPCQRIALYPEWGSPQNRRRQFCGVPGLEGEQHSPRDVR